MGMASYAKEVWVTTEAVGGGPDQAAWAKVPANTAALDASGTVLDDSAIGFNQGQRSRLIGIIEWGITMTVNYDTGGEGAAAVALIRDAWLNRKRIFAQYLPDGTIGSGWEGPTVVETFNMTGGVDDLETVDVNLLSNGPLGIAEERDTNLYQIIVGVSGDGTVALDPDKANYDYGESVTLTATDGTDTFAYWLGDLQGTENPASLTVHGRKHIIAVFE